MLIAHYPEYLDTTYSSAGMFSTIPAEMISRKAGEAREKTKLTCGGDDGVDLTKIPSDIFEDFFHRSLFRDIAFIALYFYITQISFETGFLCGVKLNRWR